MNRANLVAMFASIKGKRRRYFVATMICSMLASTGAVPASVAKASGKEIVDATADIHYRHEFAPLKHAHGTRVLIDRHHRTIYAAKGPATGADVMLDILARDGFEIAYLEDEVSKGALENAGILVIHGLPNEELTLPEGSTFWRSPLSDVEVDAIVRFVDAGGGLFLTLSHFPNGSGGKPLLEALGVGFRDGYAYHPDHPNFDDPEDGRCSHFFGMNAADGTINADHPLLTGGLPVAKVDYHCGAAIFRNPEDVVLAFPPGSQNHSQGSISSTGNTVETADHYAGMIAFDYGEGRVVVASDQGLFRNFIFHFDTGEDVYVTITGPENDNANLFINMMRWLSPTIAKDGR